MTEDKDLAIAGTATDTLTVIAITGTDSMPYGTTSATFTATIKNIGTTPSIFAAKSVTFYVGPTLTTPTTIHTTGLDVINPNATVDITMTKNFSTWPVGTYSICAKTSDE